jgi:hypothetical protein
MLFVASGGIPTSGLGVGHVGIFVGTTLDFCLVKTPLDWSLGLHGLVDGIWGLVLGCHTHKEE